MTLVLPGDVVHSAQHPIPTLRAADIHIKLGPGLLPERVITSSSSSTAPSSSSAAASTSIPTLVATRAGILGHVPGRPVVTSSGSHVDSEGSKRSSKRAKIETLAGSAASTSDRKPAKVQTDGLWVEANTRRYIPAPSDTVIGQITARGPDFYTVSLLSSHTAALPVLAFEGATKRHRPNLRVGSLVYARVVSAERHTDPELSCVNPVNGKSDGLGELKVAEREVGCAMVFKISLGLASSLLHPAHPLLGRIAAHFPFESAIGHNGLLWARTAQPAHLIALGQILHKADTLSLSSFALNASAEQDEKQARQKKNRKKGGGGTVRKGRIEDDEAEEDREEEDEDEAMEVDEVLGVSDKNKSASTSIQAQEAARLRGALSVSQVKQLIGGFL